MGHAGAIVAADGTGSADNKEKALRAAGVHIADTTADVTRIVKEILGL
jgi:succinyl-CoA synthetase alpha subunit